MAKNTVVLTNPLLRHKLGILRDKETNSSTFRDLLKEISAILAYEAMKDWTHLAPKKVSTPIGPAEVSEIINPPVVVSVMRAGNGMLDGVLTMLPLSSVGYIGLYRDKAQHRIVEYFCKLPEEIRNKDIFLCDPLIASADSILVAIQKLKEFSVGQIHVLSILASNQGLEKIQARFPDIKVYTLNIEIEMNENGYLVPGLGDAGDRLYQTK